MQVRDGFIVGVYNYCDRWCERCAFTSRCRVFADVAEMHASLDPNLKAVVEAPPLSKRSRNADAQLDAEMLDDEASTTPMPAEEWERLRPRISPEHQPIDVRARRYGTKTDDWLNVHDGVGHGANRAGVGCVQHVHCRESQPRAERLAA